MKKISKNKIIKIVVAVLLIVAVVATAILINGKKTGAISKGNNDEYNVSSLATNPDSKMVDDPYVFIGSDFTFGAKSDGQSYVDYLKHVDGLKAKRYGGVGYKLNGKNDEKTIVSTFNKVVEKNINPMVVFCEIPACQTKGRQKNGELSGGYYIGDLDTTTVYGALEYICASADMNWGCKVVFITCPSRDNKKYDELVSITNEVADKWGTKVINFYNNEEITFDSKEKKLYFVDDSSPTKAAFNKVYGPKVEEFINRYFYL